MADKGRISFEYSADGHRQRRSSTGTPLRASIRFDVRENFKDFPSSNVCSTRISSTEPAVRRRTPASTAAGTSGNISSRAGSEDYGDALALPLPPPLISGRERRRTGSSISAMPTRGAWSGIHAKPAGDRDLGAGNVQWRRRKHNEISSGCMTTSSLLHAPRRGRAGGKKVILRRSSTDGEKETHPVVMEETPS